MINNYGNIAIANRGGPYVQRYLVVNNEGEIDNEVITPTSEEIISTFIHYIGIVNPLSPENADAQFVLDNGVLTNLVNSSSQNWLLGPTNYPAVYQTVRLSSTNRDDDRCGWLVGHKIEGGRRHFLYVRLQLSDQPYPVAELRTTSIPDSTPQSTPADNEQGSLLFSESFGDWAASNAEPDNLDGWLQPPWDDGIYCRSSFNGDRLTVDIKRPGDPNVGGQVRISWDFDQSDFSELAGFQPNSGLYTSSQIGCRWTNYGFSKAGREALNLQTQTLWLPNDGTFPLTYQDSGIPIWQLIRPGRYARSETNNRWMKVDPYTRVASLSTPAPF